MNLNISLSVEFLVSPIKNSQMLTVIRKATARLQVQYLSIITKTMLLCMNYSDQIIKHKHILNFKVLVIIISYSKS